MNSAKINDWMQVAGLFGVIGSLIFVGQQLTQDRVIATVDAMSSLTEAMSEFALDREAPPLPKIKRYVFW